jgi:hypothetical protein
VGWGRNAKQSSPSTYQQTLYLPITDLGLCHSVYGKTLPITDNQLCAGGETGNDACAGFGGAPLMVRHGDTHYQVKINTKKSLILLLTVIPRDNCEVERIYSVAQRKRTIFLLGQHNLNF